MNRRNFITDSIKAVAALAVAPLAFLFSKEKELDKEDSNVLIKTIELPYKKGEPHAIWTPFETYTCHFTYEYEPTLKNGKVKIKNNFKKIINNKSSFQKSPINIKRLIKHNKK